MKTKNSALPLLSLLLASLFALALTSALAAEPAGIFASDAKTGGRLMIKCSPILGAEVGINIKIDGKDAGDFAKGAGYDKFITPGKHVISATASGSLSSEWHATVDVRAGQTYSYEANSSNDKLTLTPLKTEG